MGGGFLPRLNICLRPISHKYREGKVKRTLKRESNRARNYDDGNLCSLHKRKALRGGGVLSSLSGAPRSWDTVTLWGELSANKGCAIRLRVRRAPGRNQKREGEGPTRGFRGGTRRSPLPEPHALPSAQLAFPSGGGRGGRGRPLLPCSSPDVCFPIVRWGGGLSQEQGAGRWGEGDVFPSLLFLASRSNMVPSRRALSFAGPGAESEALLSSQGEGGRGMPGWLIGRGLLPLPARAPCVGRGLLEGPVCSCSRPQSVLACYPCMAYCLTSN